MLIAPLFFLGMCQAYVFGGEAAVGKTGQITSYSTTGGEDGEFARASSGRIPALRE